MIPCHHQVLHLTLEQKIPFPRTFEEYDSRELNGEQVVFSSMSYLIDAMRIASSTCSTRVVPFCPGDRAILAADAKFVNWLLYLPRCKQEAVKEDRTIDETMFLAHVCINVERMLLHRPHSVLAFSEIETRSNTLALPRADRALKLCDFEDMAECVVTNEVSKTSDVILRVVKVLCSSRKRLNVVRGGFWAWRAWGAVPGGVARRKV